MFKMRLLCVLGLLFSQLMMAQLKTVTGVISDEEGIPLPGATAFHPGPTEKQQPQQHLGANVSM